MKFILLISVLSYISSVVWNLFKFWQNNRKLLDSFWGAWQSFKISFDVGFQENSLIRQFKIKKIQKKVNSSHHPTDLLIKIYIVFKMKFSQKIMIS